jgi:hypothetical protein
MRRKMCIYKCMLNVYKNQQNRQTGSRNLMGPKTLPTIWGTYMKLVTTYQISGINSYWWQESDIWSQASYRYTILWVAFLGPSDSYFLLADLVGFYTHWTYILIFRWQKSDIWSQASYSYPISWEAFLEPSDSWPNIRFLPSTVTEKNATKNILDGRKDGHR